MKILMTLKNYPPEFDSAIKFNVKVLTELLKSGITKEIYEAKGTKPKLIEEISEKRIGEFLIRVNKNSIKNSTGLNKTPLGYSSSCFFYDSLGNSGWLFLSFGRPLMSGRDCITIQLRNEKDDIILEKESLLKTGLELFKSYIRIFNPINAQLGNQYFSSILDPQYNLLGLVNYYSQDYFKEININNLNISREKFGNGYLYILNEENKSKLKVEMKKFSKNIDLGKK